MDDENRVPPQAGVDAEAGEEARRREVDYLDAATPGYGGMHVREPAAVVLRGAEIDPARYPELVQQTLGHMGKVLDRLETERLEIVRLRNENRQALARLKAA